MIQRISALFLALILCMVCFSAYADEDHWICPNCGAENTTNFCTQCGTEKPETIICTGCGEKYPIDTTALFCGNCGTKLQQDVLPSIRLEGNGFDSPEAAVTCYLEGLKNLNFEQMLRAFAWETQAEHYSMETRIRRLQSYSYGTRPRLIGDSDFIRSANMYSLLAVQIDAIYQSLDVYILQEDHPYYASKTGSIVFKEDGELDDFIGKFNNGQLQKLSTMTNIQFLTPDEITDGKFSAGKNPENYIKMNAMYGADETADMPTVADIDGGVIFCCPTAARYGDKWYLVSVSSMTNQMMGFDMLRQAFVYAPGSISDLVR